LVIPGPHNIQATGDMRKQGNVGGGRDSNGTQNSAHRIYPVNLLTAAHRRQHTAYNEPWNLPEIADCVLTGAARGCYSAASGNALHPQLHLVAEATILRHNFIHSVPTVVWKRIYNPREGFVCLPVYTGCF
jgi:hypothetical protein